jgi:hypothetical protein
MPPTLSLILKVIAIVVVGFCFYASIFLYEDREKKLQNVLEDLWIRIDDAQTRRCTTTEPTLTIFARVENHHQSTLLRVTKTIDFYLSQAENVRYDRAGFCFERAGLSNGGYYF